MAPRAPLGAEFPLKVLLVMVTSEGPLAALPSFAIPPPPAVAELPLSVLLVSVTVALPRAPML